MSLARVVENYVEGVECRVVWILDDFGDANNEENNTTGAEENVACPCKRLVFVSIDVQSITTTTTGSLEDDDDDDEHNKRRANFGASFRDHHDSS